MRIGSELRQIRSDLGTGCAYKDQRAVVDGFPEQWPGRWWADQGAKNRGHDLIYMPSPFLAPFFRNRSKRNDAGCSAIVTNPGLASRRRGGLVRWKEETLESLGAVTGAGHFVAQWREWAKSGPIRVTRINNSQVAAAATWGIRIE